MLMGKTTSSPDATTWNPGTFVKALSLPKDISGWLNPELHLMPLGLASDRASQCARRI